MQKKTTLRIVLFMAPTLMMVGCATLRVNHDFDQRADFSQFRTYQWVDGEANLADNDPLVHRRVVEAIDDQLSQKGLRQVESAPDVYITYNAESNERVSIDTAHYGYGYGPGWGWGGGLGLASSTSTVRTYEQGTVIVDIWDAGQEELVWRGVATDTVSENPRSNEQKIMRAAERLFRQYPPAARD